MVSMDNTISALLKSLSKPGYPRSIPATTLLVIRTQPSLAYCYYRICYFNIVGYKLTYKVQKVSILLLQQPVHRRKRILVLGLYAWAALHIAQYSLILDDK